MLGAANGGAFPSGKDDKHQALRAALELEPPAYDADWWTEHVLDNRRADPYQRFEAIEHAAEHMTTSLLRIHMAYERTGRTWAEGAPAATPTNAPAQTTSSTPSDACPTNLTAYRGTTATLTCNCPPGVSNASVWGGDPTYTDDSSVCWAAVHAGVITAAAGGPIRVATAPGRDSYSGSTRNGVTTSSYGVWGGSYSIEAPN